MISAPAAKASIPASTRLGSCSRPPTRAPSTKALEAITPNKIACPTPRRYPLLVSATPEDPRQAFPFINVAIWRNADAYLAAFGGQAPEAGSKPRIIERDLPAPASRKDGSYPAAADDSACSTTSIAWPVRQCDRCRVAGRSGGLVCPGPSLWRDPATGEGRCAGRLHYRYVGVHRRDGSLPSWRYLYGTRGSPMGRCILVLRKSRSVRTAICPRWDRPRRGVWTHVR